MLGYVPNYMCWFSLYILMLYKIVYLLLLFVALLNKLNYMVNIIITDLTFLSIHIHFPIVCQSKISTLKIKHSINSSTNVCT